MDDLMDNFSIAMESDSRVNHELLAERALVAAIFAQAYDDLLRPPPCTLFYKHGKKKGKLKKLPVYKSGKKKGKLKRLHERVTEYLSAVEFVNVDNENFKYYCHLIDLQPRYVVDTMMKQLEKARANRALKPIMDGKKFSERNKKSNSSNRASKLARFKTVPAGQSENSNQAKLPADQKLVN